MKKAIQKMQARKEDKNGGGKESKKVRTTISIDDDLAPRSEKVRARIRARRAANYSNFVEVLIAEDLKLTEAAAA